MIGLRRMGMAFSYDMRTPRVPVEETWGAMAEVVAVGKARQIGLSEVNVEQIPLAEVLPYCEEQGIAFLPFSPLGRGFLAGRFASFDELPEDDFRRRPGPRDRRAGQDHPGARPWPTWTRFPRRKAAATDRLTPRQRPEGTPYEAPPEGLRTGRRRERRAAGSPLGACCPS